MKKPLSESKMTDSITLQGEGVYTLKISHFDPQIYTRCSHEEKIMRRREMVQTATSRYEKTECFPQKDRRVRSSQEVRMQPSQKINKLQMLQQLNQEIEVLTPILDGRIIELKSLMYRKACNTNRQASREHNVHFTQYVLRSQFPSSPTVLHSRNKKECPFMRSVKARSLMSKSMEAKQKRPIDDIFKSIELNNSSKYASSKRIAVSGDNIASTPKNSKNKGNLARQAAKNYNDRRQQLIARRQNVLLSTQKKEDDCRPWETQHRLDIMNDDVDLIHL